LGPLPPALGPFLLNLRVFDKSERAIVPIGAKPTTWVSDRTIRRDGGRPPPNFRPTARLGLPPPAPRPSRRPKFFPLYSTATPPQKGQPRPARVPRDPASSAVLGPGPPFGSPNHLPGNRGIWLKSAKLTAERPAQGPRQARGNFFFFPRHLPWLNQNRERNRRTPCFRPERPFCCRLKKMKAPKIVKVESPQPPLVPWAGRGVLGVKASAPRLCRFGRRSCRFFPTKPLNPAPSGSVHPPSTISPPKMGRWVP